MTQQFAALSECMADECPLVRAAAVAGAAQVGGSSLELCGVVWAMCASWCRLQLWRAQRRRVARP
eukprot:scaffold202184_cov27-Tisochrysis_lutea.AAC.2